MMTFDQSRIKELMEQDFFPNEKEIKKILEEGTYKKGKYSEYIFQLEESDRILYMQRPHSFSCLHLGTICVDGNIPTGIIFPDKYELFDPSKRNEVTGWSREPYRQQLDFREKLQPYLNQDNI